MKMRAFWDIAQCSLVGIDWRLRGAYFLYHQCGDHHHSSSVNHFCVFFPIAYTVAMYARVLFCVEYAFGMGRKLGYMPVSRTD
jgi:hypothetical protein